MKFLILSFAIFSFCVTIYAKQDEESSCRDIHGSRKVKRECSEKIDNQFEELVEQFNETVYTNANEASVKLWAKQICEYATSLSDCLAVGYTNVIPECQNHTSVKDDAISHFMIKAAIDYLCTDDGKLLVEISENDGFHCLFHNDRYDKCHSILYSESPSKRDTDEFVFNPLFCESFNKAKECFVEISNDCPNQKVKVIGAAAIDHSNAVACEP